MVVGSGMIASRFEHYKNDDSKIIFASGVSNSKNSKEENFERELQLLNDTIKNNPDKSLIYFSTCSIDDKDLVNSPYVLHKINIENFIKQRANKFFIFRVSNVAGVSNNPYTLLNNFIFNVLHNNALTIWKNAYRNIIGIDDLFSIADKILQKGLYQNKTTNIANPQNYSVPFIIQKIEEHLHKKAIFKMIDKGSDYGINVSSIEPIIKACNINFTDDYLITLLKKYYHSK